MLVSVPVRRAVAVVIRAPAAQDPGADHAPAARSPGDAPRPGGTAGVRWLLVRRPDDDEDLPGVWGLPAGSAAPGESEEALVRRIGREKLGVTLRPVAALASGGTDRADYRLEMTLWGAEVEAGEIRVPQPVAEVTQYTASAWRAPGALGPGAAQGSLCCRLGLRWSGAG